MSDLPVKTISPEIDKLLTDPDVLYKLEDNPLIAELLAETDLRALLETGEVSVDFETVNSEIILLYQALFQLQNDEGEGFKMGGLDLVRKTVKDIAALKKIGKELKDKRQVNKDVFNQMMSSIASALDIALMKVLHKRELADAILMEVWRNVVEPGIRQGIIEEGVSNPVSREMVEFEEV